MPGWRNWQTQRTQNPPTFGSWGFDSPSRHHTRHSFLQRSKSSIRAVHELSCSSGEGICCVDLRSNFCVARRPHCRRRIGRRRFVGFASETELPLLRSEHSRRDGKAEKKRQNRINDWKKGKDRTEEGPKEATPGRKSWVGLLAADLSLSGAESSAFGNAYKNLQKCERSVKTTWDCPKELVESYRRGESLG
jgi:hypothetical protein